MHRSVIAPQSISKGLYTRLLLRSAIFGIDKDLELVNLATEDKIISKSGAWYKYNDANVAQGLSNCAEWLSNNPEIKAKIKQEILANRGLE